MPRFDQPALLSVLHGLDDRQLDDLHFGVIGFDSDGLVRRYNLTEQHDTGLQRGEVMGHALFTDVAQCLNNFMVAQRFDDARSAGQLLDATLPFTLTWRMRPTPVALRLMADPTLPLQYLALRRLD